jgi:hypothetical protein
MVLARHFPANPEYEFGCGGSNNAASSDLASFGLLDFDTSKLLRPSSTSLPLIDCVSYSQPHIHHSCQVTIDSVPASRPTSDQDPAGTRKKGALYASCRVDHLLPRHVFLCYPSKQYQELRLESFHFYALAHARSVFKDPFAA